MAKERLSPDLSTCATQLTAHSHEARQHELRLSIEHRKLDIRREGPEPDSVNQASSGYDKASLFQTSDRDQQVLQVVEGALIRMREG